MRKEYEAPSIQMIGSLRDLTQQLTKVGSKPDVFSSELNQVGSIVPPD